MQEPPRILSLVLVPALLTLVITVVRVVGELQGWNPALFGSDAGGGAALVGITWLVLVFGAWFGFRLRRGGATVALGRAAIVYAIALAVMVGGFLGLTASGLVTMPTEEQPGQLEGLEYALGLMALAAVVALVAWPRLTLTLLVYGYLARLPVVAVTWLDLSQGWDTHYGALPPAVVVRDDSERLMALLMPQLTLWPLVFTPIVGGLCGCLGARLAGSKRG